MTPENHNNNWTKMKTKMKKTILATALFLTIEKNISFE